MTLASSSNQGMLCVLLLLSSFLSSACGFSAHRSLQISTRGKSFTRSSAHPLLVEEDSSIETETSRPLTQGNGDLPTVIQQIADERQEFNMNLGKAMDTLRKDMPDILRSPPGT